MRPKHTILALAAILAAAPLLAAPARAEETPVERVERVMEAPPATGLIVTGVGADSEAAHRGVRAGDVLTAYDGVPTRTLEALTKAKRVAAQTLGATVTLELTRPGGEAVSLPIGTGVLGIQVLPVTKGRPATNLPPATAVTFAVDRLRSHPLDEWFGFRFPPAPKVGFEHGILTVEGDAVHLRREVAFDGGRNWGLNHFDVTVTMDGADPLKVRKVTYAYPLQNFQSTGRPVRREDGTLLWYTDWTGRNEETGEAESGAEEIALPTDLPIVPSYFVEALASLVEKQDGACFHFRPLSEGDGVPGLKSALIVVKKEDVAEGDAHVGAWRVEQRRAGGQVVGVYWIADDGRTIRADYGGPVAYRRSKEEATSNIHPDFKVRSGG